MRQVLVVAIGLCVLALSGTCSAQSNERKNSAAERAMQEYRAGQYAAAERDCRDLVKQNPSNIFAQFYLAQSLFMEKKYAESVGPFEKARQLEAGGTKLTSDQHRVLIDQLVIADGIGGNLKRVHELLDQAIRQDPDYPINYYNLACAYAGENDKPKMLANLALAFQHKDDVLKGEHMPDPRTDDSFKNYVQDPDFLNLMKEIGYN